MEGGVVECALWERPADQLLAGGGGGGQSMVLSAAMCLVQVPLDSQTVFSGKCRLPITT